MLHRNSFQAITRSVLGGLCALAAFGVGADRAMALQPSAATIGRPELELAAAVSGKSTDASIPATIVWDKPPSSTAAAYRVFVADVGAAGLRASFNRTTGVPSRIFGRGIPAAGSMADGGVAEKQARALLERHIALLAPGASAADFDVISNDYDATPRGDGLAVTPTRTVGFRQHYVTASGKRLEVRGGQVSFRFKNDVIQMIGSEAIPMIGVSLEVPAPGAATGDIAHAALTFVEGDFGSSTVTSPVSEPFVFAFVDSNGKLSHSVARSVVVETAGVKSPGPGKAIGRFEVFVDARSGAPIARKQLLHFDGNLALHVTTRSPTFGPRADLPAVKADLTVDGNGAGTDVNGVIAFAAPQADVIAFAGGADVFVTNAAGAKAQTSFQLLSGQTFVWDASTDELVDAQLDSFVHGREVREYAKSFAPTLSFLDSAVSASVNISDVCNAFSDGTNLNFYKSGMGCENTGRIADVIYHEYGHSIHNHAIIPGVGVFEGALSEGIADYLAGTITGDHGMGRGFFFTNEPLRDLDPMGKENRWPDDLVGEVHEDGKIIGQTLWDLRTALIAKLGNGPGIAHADHLFYEGIRRATDIPSMYPEVIAADDDDGNLENGTPNICEINAAFALHGLRAYSADGSPLSLEPVKQDGYTITAELKGLYAQCPGDALTSAKLKWRDQAQPAGGQDLPMTVNGFQLSGVIPPQVAGTVIQYSIGVDFSGTTSLLLPDNAADRWYQFYVGDVTPLYCTDFETDPAAQGWTHGLSMGMKKDGADDWEWGKPKGTSTNGDPTEAFSGKKVYGNDLGDLANHNGEYQPDIVNYALSPVVDATGYDTVRLQYRRWLNVEDGHFDHATIYANDKTAWTNFDSDMGDASRTDHTDREWRFQDVDLTPYLVDGKVQVKFEINSDPGKELGGWTLDDFCVVGVKKAPIDPCANGGCGGAGGASITIPRETINGDPSGGCDCALDDHGDADLGSYGVTLVALGVIALGARRKRWS